MKNKNPMNRTPLAAAFLFFSAFLFAAVSSRAEADYEKGAAARTAGDYETALNEWLVTSDDPRCMTAIGSLYDYGEGMQRDEARAAEWYKKAADKGEFRAMAQLAKFSLTGAGGVAQNPAEWRSKLEGIEGRDGYADYVLASFYIEGHGGEKNLEKANAILNSLVAEKGYAQLAEEQKRVSALLADARAGVLDADEMAAEMKKDRAAFDEKYRDRRVTLRGWLKSAERLNDLGYFVRLGSSAAPGGDVLAVFSGTPDVRALTLEPRVPLRLSGVYVGEHPFQLGECAFTLFGCLMAGSEETAETAPAAR